MKYQHVIGIISILSAVLSITCLFTGLVAVNFNFEAFSNPLSAIEYSGNHKMAFWFLILDMFGYYLLIVPMIFYIHQQYKFRSPWTPLITFSGLAYVLIGSIGAVTLAATWPMLMQLYLKASPENYENVTIIFSALTLFVTNGLWNILQAIFASVWFMGSGIFILHEYKKTRVLGIVVGCATLLDAAGNMLNLGKIAEIGLNVYLLGSIFFALAIGIILLGFRNIRLKS